MIRLLAVDDSALMRRLLGQIFAAQPDITLRLARGGREALAMLPEFDPHVVTLDVQMPEMDGLACLDRIMLADPRPVVMLSSLTGDGADAALEALRLGAVDVMAKPGGAISLSIEEMAPRLVAKVRAAAGARLRGTARLRDKLRLRSGLPPEPSWHEPPWHEPPQAAGTGLVLIGASTGGPPALETVLTRLPAGFPWPLVVAQHMPASFTASLARRLNGLCALQVCEVAKPMLLLPGHAYIARGDADIVFTRTGDGVVAQPSPGLPGSLWHPSVDRMVQSAMDIHPASRLVGVLMTGMGSDGAKAMAALHAAGGRTVAEAESSAVVWGMPGELVKAGGAGLVLALDAIAGSVMDMVI